MNEEVNLLTKEQVAEIVARERKWTRNRFLGRVERIVADSRTVDEATRKKACERLSQMSCIPSTENCIEVMKNVNAKERKRIERIQSLKADIRDLEKPQVKEEA